jgi:POT family proton-dependent oligopeptide transporter
VWNLLAIAGLVVLFRIAYEQSGNTIAFWADGRTDRVLQIGTARLLIPATWFQSINPLLIFTLTPVITLWWTRQAKLGREPAPLRKMAFGATLLGLAFLLMVGAAREAGTAGTASWLWLVGFFALLTAGELFVVPVGLSVFSQLAPARVASLMIGVWYLAKFAGGLFAGWLGSQWQAVGPERFFLIGAAFAFIAAVAFRLKAGRSAP